MIRALAGVILPVLAVWAGLIATGLRERQEPLLLGLARAFCLAMGLTSISTFATLMVGGRLNAAFVIVDAAVWTCLAGVSIVAMLRRPSLPLKPRAPLTSADIAVRTVFLVVAVCACGVPVFEYLASPHGQWDAWAIWNQKARFMYRAGPGWTDSMAIPWSQPGHPPLVAGTVARLWAYAGGELTAVPAMVAGLFAIAMAGIVMGTLGLQHLRAWVAGAILIAPWTFSHLAAAQTADLPLGVFIVASLATLPRTPREWQQRGWVAVALVLAGVLGSMAAWTKNEGFVYLAASTALVCWSSYRHGRLADVRWWLVGLAPLLSVIVAFKVFVVPATTDYLVGTSESSTIIARVLDGARQVRLVETVATLAFRWGGTLTAGSLLLMLLLAAGLGALPEGRTARGYLFVSAVMLAGYSVVYLLTPFDVVWLISTTFDRLTLQVWPVLVLAACTSAEGVSTTEAA